MRNAVIVTANVVRGLGGFALPPEDISLPVTCNDGRDAMGEYPMVGLSTTKLGWDLRLISAGWGERTGMDP